MKNVREDIVQVIEKTNEFLSSSKTGMALLKVKSVAGLKTMPRLNLLNYCFPNDVEKYIDDRAQRAKLYWDQRIGIKDYVIPSLAPWYGIAEHSAFMGGVVAYSEETSWPEIVMNSAHEHNLLTMDENNTSFRIVVDGIKYIREKYSDIFAPMVRGCSGVLEMANAFRGSDFFFDFYNEDGSLEAFLDRCEEGLIWYYDKQLEAAGDFLGGTMTGFGEWLPGRALGHISEDTSTMISVDQFNEFGKPRTQRICDKYSSAFMHTHALSEHCLETISQIKGLYLMEISSDPNTDRAVEVFRRNKEKLQEITPVLLLTREEIMNNLDMLKSQKTVIWYDATSLEDAEDMCRFVEKELPIK